ncbi:MAG TPA: metallophosphoesterase [Thermoleophilaceae bacterium]|nr:metallophosphoesterase [Thermoleophilaceae bacterium]
MRAPTSVLAANLTGDARLRIAAAGDIHCSEDNRDAVLTAFDAIEGEVDVVLLAGDLTTHGEPEQGAVLADACRGMETPVVAVLGNHDLHANRPAELVEVLEDGGIQVLDRSHTTVRSGSCRLGIAGTKGFVGGFRGLALPDFGEPSLRRVYAETGAELEALASGLHEIALCPFRVALLHYAPVAETLHGEAPEIWTYLGSDRLAAPILEHRPDLVLHGHAHAGRLQAELEGIPVFNVSVPVMGQDFWVFEMSGAARAATAIH